MAGMKSAVELAMEKLGAKPTQEVAPLTDEQRQTISDLRKQYDAKIAEKEIMMQAEIRKLSQRHPPQEVVRAARELQAQFQQNKKHLLEELEGKIAGVRTSH